MYEGFQGNAIMTIKFVIRVKESTSTRLGVTCVCVFLYGIPLVCDARRAMGYVSGIVVCILSFPFVSSCRVGFPWF